MAIRVVHNADTFLDTWSLARIDDSNYPDTAANHAVVEWWSKPEIGSIKFICDASIFSSENKFGVGWLAHDHNGVLLETAADVRVGSVE